MIEKYEKDYDLYLKDQIERFESFEGNLYRIGITQTIDLIFQRGLVLDLCCGDGTTSSLLSKKGFMVHGVDANPRKIARATELYEAWNMSFSICEADKIKEVLKPNSYDIIYASHCFEHFLDPMKVLSDAGTLLKPNGTIYMILPYPNEESDGHPGSEKLMLNRSLDEVKNNFIQHGFRVKSILQCDFREPEIIIELQ